MSTACLGDDARAPSAARPRRSAPPRRTRAPASAPTRRPGGFGRAIPDVTGGYFQPVRARRGATAFALERDHVQPANTSADIARAFAQAYVPNANPRLAPDRHRSTAAPHARRHPGRARVTFHAAWADADAETYVRSIRHAGDRAHPREAMRVSCYATAGAFDADRTGRDED